MRLIDADALSRLTQIYEFNGKRMEMEIVDAKFIDNAPTIDAVPVVRCKDCKFWSDTPSDILVRKCNVRSGYASDNDYCSYGERKDNE